MLAVSNIVQIDPSYKFLLISDWHVVAFNGGRAYPCPQSQAKHTQGAKAYFSRTLAQSWNQSPLRSFACKAWRLRRRKWDAPNSKTTISPCQPNSWSLCIPGTKKRLFLRYVENPIAGQVTLESRMAMPSTPGPPAGSGTWPSNSVWPLPPTRAGRRRGAIQRSGRARMWHYLALPLPRQCCNRGTSRLRAP